MTLYPCLQEPAGVVHAYCTARCRNKGTPLAFRAMGRRGGSVLRDQELPLAALPAPARCAWCQTTLH